MRDLDFKYDVPMGQYTTIGIGGPAKYFVEATDTEDLRAALAWASAQGYPVLVLGGGSNMLVADTGWPGLVIKQSIRGIDSEQTDAETTRLICGGGETWDDLVVHAVNAGLQGIECLSGIPGTVGASPIQNIGAYGQEVKETIAWVEALDKATGQERRFTNHECGFDYRWSRFKGDDRDRYIVTRVAFDLKPGASPSVRYGDLTKYFEQRAISSPTLADVRAAVLEVRGSKGMVVDPTVPDSRSCGSFFMNPIVSSEQAAQVKEKLEQAGLVTSERPMPEFPAGEGRVKLSAAYLMDKAGLQKGSVFGGVGISSRHVLALINCGGGSAAEILDLVAHVQKTVREAFDIDLHPEPVFIGFSEAVTSRVEGGQA